MSPSDSLRLIAPMERALFLKTLGPVARALSPDEIGAFAEHARERHFRAGERLFDRGKAVDRYHTIVEGAVHAAGGEYLSGRDLGPRESLGFLSMLAALPDGLDAVATEDTVTLEFEDDVLYEILEDSFDLVHAVVRVLAGQTLELRRRIPPGTYLAPMEGALHSPGGRPLDLVERILLLRRPASPFEHASLDAITDIARATPQLRFDPGVTLWKSGDRADHMLIIVSGTVACTTQWGLSRFRAGPGYPLGNLERFSEDPRWFSAVTETEVVALRSETESFLDVLEDHFDVALLFTRAMARRVIRLGEETAAETRAVA